MRGGCMLTRCRRMLRAASRVRMRRRRPLLCCRASACRAGPRTSCHSVTPPHAMPSQNVALGRRSSSSSAHRRRWHALPGSVSTRRRLSASRARPASPEAPGTRPRGQPGSAAGQAAGRQVGGGAACVIWVHAVEGRAGIRRPAPTLDTSMACNSWRPHLGQGQVVGPQELTGLAACNDETATIRGETIPGPGPGCRPVAASWAQAPAESSKPNETNKTQATRTWARARL